MRKSEVLFLCTGNSCRSQMAEGFLRHYAGDRFEALSAGTHPGTLNPRAVQVMRELGIDISGQRSKSVDEFRAAPIATVITVCDQARQECPFFPGAENVLHWSIEDPASATGTEEERLAVFRRIRDEIERRVREYVARVPTEIGTTKA